MTKRAELKDELEQVREAGYAVAVDELEAGLTAAAAPIRNAHGDVVASMSVSGPTFRLTEERLAEASRCWSRRPRRSRTGSGWGQRT